MKQVRKIARNPLVLFPLIGCFTIVSCKKIVYTETDNGSSNVIEMKSNQQYSGEDFYDGIFLKRGDVVNQLSVFNGKSTIESLDLNASEMATINTAADAIKAKVHELDGTYFDNLEAAIISNDHIAITEMLHLGASLTMTAIDDIEEFNLVQGLMSNAELRGEIIERIGQEGFDDLLNNPTREKVAEIQAQLSDIPNIGDYISNAQCIIFGLVVLVGVAVLAAAVVGVVVVVAGGMVAVTDVAVTTAAESESGGTEEAGTESGGGIANPGGTLQFEQLVQDLVSL